MFAVKRWNTGTSREQRDRATIVRLIFIVYWLLIFEGALRKWLLPGLSKELFFIRDPFVLAIYFLALRSRLFDRAGMLYWAMALSVLVMPVMFIHFAWDDVNPIVLAFGWRNYFYYVPLAFVMGSVLTAADFRRLVRQSAWVAIGMFALVYLQHVSSPTAFINRGTDPYGYVFQVVTGVVRATGTFTFTAGFSLYAASMFAMMLAAWLRPDIAAFVGVRLRLAASVATLGLIALSGSRTAIILTALILASSMILPFAVGNPRQRLRMLMVPVSLGLGGALLAVTLFSSALAQLNERQTEAVEQEGSTVTRALSSFYAFTGTMDETPLLGYGIGFGTNGGMIADNVNPDTFRLAEDEWSRIYLELGPVLALAEILFRIALVVWLGWGALRAAWAATDVLPLLLFSFIGLILLNGQITLQGTINGFGWLFCGWTLGAIRAARLKAGTDPGRGVPRGP